MLDHALDPMHCHETMRYGNGRAERGLFCCAHTRTHAKKKIWFFFSRSSRRSRRLARRFFINFEEMSGKKKAGGDARPMRSADKSNNETPARPADVAARCAHRSAPSALLLLFFWCMRATNQYVAPPLAAGAEKATQSEEREEPKTAVYSYRADPKARGGVYSLLLSSILMCYEIKIVSKRTLLKNHPLDGPYQSLSSSCPHRPSLPAFC